MATGSEEPRLRVIWTDPITGHKGYAVIDRMVNGLAGGGTRMRAGLTLEEVERLARTMSYKNGAFNLPGGGAKGGVDIDPHDPEARALLSRYVRAMTPLYRAGWGTAEDLGVTQELLRRTRPGPDRAGHARPLRRCGSGRRTRDARARDQGRGHRARRLHRGLRGRGGGGGLRPIQGLGPQRHASRHPGVRVHGRVERALPGEVGVENRRRGGRQRDDHQPGWARRRAPARVAQQLRRDRSSGAGSERPPGAA